jgi:Tfp pilus assembly protein PilW
MAAVKRSLAFGLPEVLLAVFVAALLLNALVSFAAMQVRAFRDTRRLLAAGETVRIALDVIARDLRQAGFDPRGAAIAPVAAASATALTLQRDEDGDGAVDAESEEVVAYALRLAYGIVGRQSMPLADGLAADGFRLTYFDAAGAEIAPAGGALDAAALARVRRVRVALRLHAPGRGLLAAGATDVVLRNQPWTP